MKQNSFSVWGRVAGYVSGSSTRFSSGSGSLLATSAVSPGVPDSIRRLINNQDENKLWRVSVQNRLVGKTFAAAAQRLREKYGVLLLGMIREEENIQLGDIPSDDSTFIDEFICKKFEESGKDYFGGKPFAMPPSSRPLRPMKSRTCRRETIACSWRFAGT